MNSKTKQLIQKYSKAPQLLRAKASTFNEEELQFKPSPNKWSIKEIIIHLADSEVNAFLRYRTIIAEPTNDTFVVDEWKWSQELKYQNQPLDHYLNLFESLRSITVHQLQLCEESDWDKYVIHKDFGKITLKMWLELYVDHFEQHMNQIERTSKIEY
ncbi:DinB family protein [Flammeovirga sp. OC4]|uniref:DinB family protein n=1 Tax=Flammeovirga sp. OC4 TaxID=1382345 RepID=UPI0005C466ED|nr:DinB family protein [Flammeovirga sp. OC4]